LFRLLPSDCELQSEPAAIERAVELRGGWVLVLPESLLNPIAESAVGFLFA